LPAIVRKRKASANDVRVFAQAVSGAHARRVAVWSNAMTEVALHAKSRRLRRMHPLAVRIMHWTNAFAMVIMIGSGWKIYNDEVLFGWLHFPEAITIGGEAQGALQWHFLGMWIFTFNLICYLVYGLVSGRFWRKLLPIWPRQVIGDIGAALRFKLSHDDITRYNAVQRVLYVGIILVLIVQVISGLAIWKPVQFQELTALFYDFQGARLAHFICMALIVGFLLVHVLLALAVPKTLAAMITGGPPVVDDSQPPPTSGASP
jgi:thiosulfate reductase cytochrome b subunit